MKMNQSCFLEVEKKNGKFCETTLPKDQKERDPV